MKEQPNFDQFKTKVEASIKTIKKFPNKAITKENEKKIISELEKILKILNSIKLKESDIELLETFVIEKKSSKNSNPILNHQIGGTNPDRTRRIAQLYIWWMYFNFVAIFAMLFISPSASNETFWIGIREIYNGNCSSMSNRAYAAAGWGNPICRQWRNTLNTFDLVLAGDPITLGAVTGFLISLSATPGYIMWGVNYFTIQSARQFALNRYINQDTYQAILRQIGDDALRQPSLPNDQASVLQENIRAIGPRVDQPETDVQYRQRMASWAAARPVLDLPDTLEDEQVRAAAVEMERAVATIPSLGVGRWGGRRGRKNSVNKKSSKKNKSRKSNKRKSNKRKSNKRKSNKTKK